MNIKIKVNQRVRDFSLTFDYAAYKSPWRRCRDFFSEWVGDGEGLILPGSWCERVIKLDTEGIVWALRHEGNEGVYNAAAATMVAPRFYDSAGIIGPGEVLSELRLRDKIGYVNPYTGTLIPCVFSAARIVTIDSKARKELVAVKKGRKWGIMAQDGYTVLPLEYDEIGNAYHCERIRVRQGKLWGYANMDGSRPVVCMYSLAGDYSDERKCAPVVYQGQVILIDKQGKAVK